MSDIYIKNSYIALPHSDKELKPKKTVLNMKLLMLSVASFGKTAFISYISPVFLLECQLPSTAFDIGELCN